MRSRFVREDLRAAVVPWAVSRVVVVVALAMARFLESELATRGRPAQLAQGLFAWDAAWYRAIAEQGYGFDVEETVRFFPLVPLLSKGLGFLLLDHPDVALIVVANISALLFAALLHRLTQIDTGDPKIAARAAWFGVLLPPAVALVLGYAEATAMALGVGVFLAIRTGRWPLAAALGLLAGACRPVGVLLVAPLAVEALLRVAGRGHARAHRARRRRRRSCGRDGAVPPLRRDRVRRPVRAVLDPEPATLRGGFEDPFSRLARAFDDMVGGDRFGSGFHVLWAIVFLALLVVVFRRLPRSYALYCAVTLVLGLSASNLDSFERYGLSTFPFIVAIAIVTRRRDVERAVIALGAAGLFGYSLLAFFGRWVP